MMGLHIIGSQLFSGLCKGLGPFRLESQQLNDRVAAPVTKRGADLADAHAGKSHFAQLAVHADWKRTDDALFAIFLVLAVGFLQSGEITASRASVSIDSFIEPNVSLLSGPASNKNITLEYQKCDLTAFADSSMMLAVVRNLINNAIKFTRPGGTVKISACLAGEFVKITVEDDGVGMNKVTIDKLFKIGEKIVSRGTAGERGSGFGLILCKDFVIKNGGDMIVESEEGKGSRFIFTLSAEEVRGETLNKSAAAKAR